MTSISVVIPTYDRPEFLRGAITTALEQTYNDLEVVVVDDGSSEDYAPDIVNDYPENVICIRHTGNKGLSAARNTGIKQSEGKYVAFLDDDDRWHKTKLARQVAVIERDKDIGLVTCLVTSISPESKIIHCETSAPSGDCYDKLLIGNKIGTPSRVLVRRKCLDDVGGFDESLPTKQDWDFYLRVCQDWLVAAVEKHLCFRTVHQSMSSSPTAAKRDKEAVLKKHEKKIRKNGYWEQARARIFEEVGRAYLEAGNLESARKQLQKSFSITPTGRRGVMLCLSFTNPQIVKWMIEIKRTISRNRSNCADMRLTPKEIPGLNC